MAKILMTLFIAFICSGVFAETLEEKVNRLEERVIFLEQSLKPLLIQEEQKKNGDIQRQKAIIRGQQDTKFYSMEQLKEVEKLYQTFSKSSKDEKKQIIETLIEKYPQANRTGCALLYFAQMSNGEEQIKLLKQVIQNFNDCFYYNGVQTGAQARYYLGQILMRTGKQEEGLTYINELKTSYPNAVGHNGKLLIDRLK